MGENTVADGGKHGRGRGKPYGCRWGKTRSRTGETYAHVAYIHGKNEEADPCQKDEYIHESLIDKGEGISHYPGNKGELSP